MGTALIPAGGSARIFLKSFSNLRLAGDPFFFFFFFFLSFLCLFFDAAISSGSSDTRSTVEDAAAAAVVVAAAASSITYKSDNLFGLALGVAYV